MNSNNNNQNGVKNQTNREASKLITLTAFVIGYLLIDNLNSNEQNALGNFFMLIGQTLCTSGSENFRKDWAPYSNPTNSPSNGNNSPNAATFNSNNIYSTNDDNTNNPNSMSKEQTIDMLRRARHIFNQEIDKLK